ncbi:MAG: preprotein translocase subunit SecG [Verrucomicrobiota bacterium]
MSLLIGFLTFIMVVTCLILLLLILVQLPKKEAGIGTAFGGGATDALFGAGSGNVLTKLTKYASGIFLGLALLLSVLIGRQHDARNRGVNQELLKKNASGAGYVKPPPAGANDAAAKLNPPTGTNAPLMLNLTNLTIPAATNPAAAKPADGAQALPEAPANPPPK